MSVLACSQDNCHFVAVIQLARLYRQSGRQAAGIMTDIISWLGSREAGGREGHAGGEGLWAWGEVGLQCKECCAF